MKTIKIMMNGKSLTASIGSRIAELLPRAPHRGPFTPVGAIINNRLDGLYYELKSPATIETLDYSNRQGVDIYRRTASTLLYAAFADIAPEAHVVVGQSLSDGYFFEIHGCAVNAALISEIDAHMRQIVEADIPMQPEWTTVEEAMTIFERHGTPEKVEMLKQLRRSEVPIITLGKYRGLAYGPVASRTGLIDAFRIHPYEHGIVLGFPDADGNLAKSIPQQPKLFAMYVEVKRWNELVHIQNVAELNERCMYGGAIELVQVAEALHEQKISAIAEEIVQRKKTKLILIAGPSGSGKTTFSKRLTIHLKTLGLEPVAISMDNYYVDRQATPKHADGSYNFECLEALDVELFNDQMARLMRGEEIDSPYYSFPMGRRDPARSKRFKLERHQVLITEGIHGLNEGLTPGIPADRKFKIYVSALTQLCLDDHNRIFSTDTRLCRRLVRDRLFRGTSAANTIAGWASVRAGEGNYIFPFQEESDAIFNSAIAYEHALLKPYAERFLTEVSREDPSFAEASRLYRFFSYFIPILSHEVPHTSILREFVGGSAFRYR